MISPIRSLPSTLGIRGGPSAGIVMMLVLIDVALITFHLSMKYLGHPQEYVFDLGADRGYGEFMQYAKNAWAMLLLFVLLLRRRSAVYAAWAVVCAYFLVDDAFQLHEQAGWAMADAVPGWGGAAVHIGELTLMALVGLVLVVVVAATHIRAAPPDRGVSIVLAGLFTVLIVVGVGFDAIHHLFFTDAVFDAPFTTVEDGGELLTLSLIVGFLFAVAFCGHDPALARRAARSREKTPHVAMRSETQHVGDADDGAPRLL